MDILLFIISLIILYISGSRLKKANKIKVSKEEQIAEEEQTLSLLKAQNQALVQQNQNWIETVDRQKKALDYILDEKIEAQNKYQRQLQELKESFNQASSQYIYEIESNYSQCEQTIESQINALNKDKEKAEIALEKVRSSLNAATEAQLREQEKQNNLKFYSLTLDQNDINDIELLNSIKPKMKEPRALCMLIWSSYFQKQTTELCNRVLKNQNPCGIYKITNIKTGQVYIGQSLKIADRWKQHIKCGLGIDTPVTNKLYKAMLQDGILSFTFELVETCSKDELNEKEKFWITMYQSNKVGYNSTIGGS